MGRIITFMKLISTKNFRVDKTGVVVDLQIRVIFSGPRTGIEWKHPVIDMISLVLQTEFAGIQINSVSAEVKCADPGQIKFSTRTLLPPALFQKVVSTDPV